MSARTTSTRRESWAKDTARLIAVTVLPSRGWLLVTRRVRGGFCGLKESTLVRIPRYASAVGVAPNSRRVERGLGPVRVPPRVRAGMRRGPAAGRACAGARGRGVDQRRVGELNPLHDVGLLQALEERPVEGARGVHGLVELDVLPGDLLQVEDRVLLELELLAQLLLLPLGGEIRRLDTAHGSRHLPREAPRRARELGVDLLPLRAARDEDLGLLGIADLEPAHLLLEPLDERVGEDAWQRIALAILDPPVLRLALGG